MGNGVQQKYEPHFYGPVQGVVIGDNNTVTLIFPNGKEYTVPFLAPLSPPHAFVGRDTLLGDIKQQLFAGGNLALSALSGLPGVGKTALATALANDSQVISHFPDGVLWVGLGRDANDDQISALLSKWCMALSISSAEIMDLGTPEDKADAIRAAIGMRRMLLVIDDAWRTEHAFAFKLGGPNCAHLITTRIPKVAIEFSGGQERTVKVAELSETDGLALLENLAPTAVNAEPEEAQELVRAVGGLPLALVLMGKYIQVQTYNGQPRRLHAVLDQLHKAEERLLLDESQPLLGRHPSLSTELSLLAAIGISEETLDNASRRTLWALSVFPPKPNTFSEKAAVAVSDEPVDTLDTLCDFGLLESSGAGRYTLHQTIFDYARENSHEQAAYERMATFFVNYVEVHEKDHDVLDKEVDNILQALTIAFDHGKMDAFVNGVNVFYPFLESRGLYSLAENYLNQSEQAANSLGDIEGRTKTLLHLGRIAQRNEDYHSATSCWQEGFSLAHDIGNQEMVCDFLANLGIVATFLREYAQAEAYFQQGLELAREIKADKRVCVCLGNLGRVALFCNKLIRAEELYQETLALAHKINDPDLICSSLNNLGVLANTRGDNVEAEAFYRDGLVIARQSGNVEKVGVFLVNLGERACERGDRAQAEMYLREGLTLARQLNNRPRICVLLRELGLLIGERGDPMRADEYLQKSLDLAYEIGHPILIARVLVQWGEFSLQQKNLDLAAIHFQECLKIDLTSDTQMLVASVHWGTARVTATQSDFVKARRHGHKSLALLESVNNKWAEDKQAEIEQWLAEEMFVEQRR